MSYSEIKTRYEIGLLTRSEANQAIDMLNMGSDTTTYNYV